jgi:hypothetical protein
MKQIITILFLFNTCFAQVRFNSQLPDTVNVIDFFVIAGQSNTGRPLTSAFTAPQAALYSGARAKTYIFNPYITTDSFQLMNVGVNCRTENANLLQFGPEASLFKLLEQNRNRERYLMKMGIGGTSMEVAWRPGRTTFTALRANIDTAISKIVARGKTPRFVAFIWQQGETDALTETNSGLYYTNLVNFFKSMDSSVNVMYRRRGLVMTTPYKKIIGRIKPNPQVSYPYASVVREAQERYCKNFNAVLNDCDAYGMLDDEHFSATGQVDFGTAIFSVIKNY